MNTSLKLQLNQIFQLQTSINAPIPAGINTNIDVCSSTK